MHKLIVNGDDFGFNREVTDGIIECHAKGILTSTTLMVNMPAAEHAVEEGKKYPNLSIGIHLTLTQGKPLSYPQDVPNLIDEKGNFYSYLEAFRRANRFKFPVNQIEREFCAQIERFLSLGIVPSHCDSHHHIAACPQLFLIKLRVLKKYGIKKLRTHRGFYRFDRTSSERLNVLLKALRKNTVRFPYRIYYEFQHAYCKLKGFRMPDERYGFAKLISKLPLEYDIEGWERFIENMPEGISEFCTHPGLPSDDPADRPVFRKQRVAEYNLLLNPECKKICHQRNVELINFNDL